MNITVGGCSAVSRVRTAAVAASIPRPKWTSADPSAWRAASPSLISPAHRRARPGLAHGGHDRAGGPGEGPQKSRLRREVRGACEPPSRGRSAAVGFPVRTRRVPGQPGAALRFSGRWSRRSYEARTNELLDLLAQAHLTVVGRPRDMPGSICGGHHGSCARPKWSSRAAVP